MTFVVRVGGRFSVLRDGEHLPPPPTQSCGVMLLGLLSSGEAWLDRDSTARKLYPRSNPQAARTALRQTLRRSRSWLGEEAIESDLGHLRLCGTWSIDLGLNDLAKAEGAQIAPGLDHPWVEEIRRDWSPGKGDLAARDRSFVDAVCATAKCDVDNARALLLGGSSFLWQLPVADVAGMLDLTRPINSRSPSYSGYLEIRGLFEMYSCSFDSAVKDLIRAHQAELKDGQRKNARRIAQSLLFCLLDGGRMEEARQWRLRLLQDYRADLRSTIAIAAEAWNRADRGEALEIMREGDSLAPVASRHDRLHFLTNFSILAAEKKEVALSKELADRCHCEGLSELDTRWNLALSYARAIQCLAEGDTTQAISLLQATWAGSEGWPLHIVYGKESLALAHALKGEKNAATRLWNEVRMTRTMAGGTLNPRLQELSAQIKSLIS